MAKKKKEVVYEAPITRGDYEEFVHVWERLKPVLDALAGPSSARMEQKYNREEYTWEWKEGYHDITPEGVWFYDVKDTPYDDYRSAATFLIPLDDILDPMSVINRHNEKLAEIEKDRAKQQQDNEYAAYERLKAKFEGK